MQQGKCQLGVMGSVLALAVTLMVSQAVATGPAFSPDVLKALKVPPASQLRAQQVQLKQGTLYYAIIPKSYRVQPVVSDKVQRLDGFLKAFPDALVMINSGYFDPENQKTASYVTIDGKVVADPTQNERLTGNQRLKPYLERIFNRTELRTYVCREGRRYDIVEHKAETPSGCTLRHVMGGGPLLLPEDHSLQEAVIDYDKAHKLIRDPFGVHHSNARSAIGLTPAGSLIIVMVAQNPSQKAYGMNFEQVQSVLSSLGATKAMMLDGGSSSAIWIKNLPVSEVADKQLSKPDAAESEAKEEDSLPPERSIPVVYGKYTKEGQLVKRPVKSVLVVLPPQ